MYHDKGGFMKKLMILVALVAAIIAPSATATGSADSPKVTFCHATGSTTNPYVLIETAAAGAFNGHLGKGHQNGEDIIPPFEYKGQTYSQNWDAKGQAIFNNGCRVPTVPPPPSACTAGTTPVVGSNPLVCERPVYVEKIVEKVVTVPGPERVVVKTIVKTKTVVKWKTKVKKVVVNRCVPGKKAAPKAGKPDKPREYPFTP